MAELTRKYVVTPMAAPTPLDLHDPEGAFVLKPWKDPAALRALRAYRDNCYPELARELDTWIATIEGGAVVRGDVGKRNERYVRAAPPGKPARRRAPAPHARPKARRPATHRRRRRK